MNGHFAETAISMPKPLTQKKRAERRARMANEVATLMARKIPVEVAVRRVAAKNRVAVQTARLACHENQIELPRVRLKQSRMSIETMQIVVELMKGRKDSDIARQFELSRERIGQIKRNATAAGLLDLTPQWHPEVVKALYLLRQFPKPADQNYRQGMEILHRLVEAVPPDKRPKR